MGILNITVIAAPPAAVVASVVGLFKDTSKKYAIAGLALGLPACGVLAWVFLE